MYLSKKNKKYGSDILIARFNSLTEAHHAQRTLTDFGYSKDDVTVVELSHIARRAGDAQDTPQSSINRVLKTGAILVSTIFIILAFLFLKSIFSPAEIGVMILVWITLLVGGGLICCFIGAIVWRSINSKAIDSGSETMKRGKILISVKLNTSGDAREIERIWKEIGGEVVNELEPKGTTTLVNSQ
jgi:hypothetical protein